ncbi:MAG TPA: GntR family transcriptional regulator [Acidimicrobiales bacterium]|nr:GntR family transcriptional regulator [Acidimicrobiales bacterium]
MGDVSNSTTLDRESPLPLWAQLYDHLSSRLVAGEFEHDFPSEMDLATQYAVSRNTVREAMRRLRADGVVVAERGRRPRLVTTEIEQPLGAIYSLFASVQAAGLEQESVVRALDMRVDASVATHLNCSPQTPLFYLERLRLAGDEPLALDRVWMPGEVGSALLDVDFSHTALYDELHARTGLRLTMGRERIRAVVPLAEDRALLAMGPDEAALAIDRLANVHNDPVEWRQTLIRGDRFSLVAEFSARAGYQFDLSDASALSPLARRASTPTDHE